MKTRVYWLLAKYVPDLVAFLNLSEKAWSQLETKYELRMDFHAQRFQSTGDSSTADPTLVDYALRAEIASREGNAHCSVELRFLRHLNSLSADFASHVVTELRPCASRQMRDLLFNFGTVDSRFWDRLGEMAATAEVLKRTRGKLLQLEWRLEAVNPNLPTSLDLLVEMPGGSKIPIEFLNVKIDDVRVTSAEGLRAFIDKRVRAKVLSKVKIEIEDGAHLPFPLLLILRAKIETLQAYGRMLVSRQFPGECPSFAMYQLGNEDGPQAWRMTTVEEIAKFAPR